MRARWAIGPRVVDKSVGAYVGGEDDQGRLQVWFETDDGVRREVERRVSAVHGGLSWGYEGTGPGNTARTILADITQDRALAEAWHQEFRSDVVATLAVDQPFRLERGFVELWLAGKVVAVAPEWETFPAVDLAAQIGDRPPVTPVPTLEQLSDRAAVLDATRRRCRVGSKSWTDGSSGWTPDWRRCKPRPGSSPARRCRSSRSGSRSRNSCAGPGTTWPPLPGG